MLTGEDNEKSRREPTDIILFFKLLLSEASPAFLLVKKITYNNLAVTILVVSD